MKSTEQSKQPQQPAPKQRSGFAAGSEGWDGSEDPTNPVTSAGNAVEARQAQTADSDAAARQETDRSMQSDAALSRPSGAEADDGRFSVAEEQNFDQQSDAARRVGQPQDPDEVAEGGTESKGGNSTETSGNARNPLQQSVDRAIPPSP